MVAVDTRHRSEVPTTRRVIQELHELRQKGILTAEEFQAKKQELLDEL